MSLTEQLSHHAEPHAHGHKGKGLFSRRIGPLSAGAWLGVIVGGVALGMYAKNHGPFAGGSSSTADPAADNSSDPGGLTSPGAALGGSSSGGGSSQPPGAAPLADNNAWESAAIKALIGYGIRPGVAQPAVVGFLGGSLLTTEQGAAVELAIRLIGTPPDGAPALMVEPAAAAASAPSPAVPAPTTTAPAPRPVAARLPAPVIARPVAAAHPGTVVHGSAGSYTVKSGDTLSGIAARLHISSWSTLYNANRDTIETAARRHGRADSGGGHWIYPGTVLRLP